MHLDCVFSIVGDDVCIMMDEMMGESSPTRRLVDEWVRLHAGCPAGCHIEESCHCGRHNITVHFQSLCMLTR